MKVMWDSVISCIGKLDEEGTSKMRDGLLRLNVIK